MSAGADGIQRWDCEVCVVQAPSRADLLRRVADLARFLDTAQHVDLKDLAFTLNAEPPLTHGSRVSFVAATVGDLRARLEEARQRLADRHCRRIRDARGIYFFEEPLGRDGKVAILFPGEGAQYPRMLADICMRFPECREWFDLMDRAFVDHPRGYLPSELVFPAGPQLDAEDPRLWNMDGAVETVFAANQALYTLLRRLGVQPHMLAGHSSGDYSALVAAGCITVNDDDHLLRHIRALNAVYEEFSADDAIPNAALLAVGSADPSVVTRLLHDHASELSIALDNCPQQLVLCGTESAINQAERRLQSEGAVTERLPFGRPYHTPLFASFSEPLRKFFDVLDLSTPPIDVYSCATASPYPGEPIRLREVAVAQWTRPVRFRETVEAMYDAGARIFIEAGPRGNLTGFVENTLRSRGIAAIPMDSLQRRGQLNHAVALMAAQHVPMNTDYLYARRAPRRLMLDGSDLGEGTNISGAVTLSLRLPSLRLTRPHEARTPVAASCSSAGAPSEMRARVMDEYFKSMERFLSVEREVLHAALANDRSPSPAVDESRGPRPLPPFIDRIVSLDPGREAVAVCELNLDDHRFMRDHTLGANVSSFDPDLAGLPVLPLAVSIEMLAEAASLVRPGLVAVGARGLKAHRWVILEAERLLLRLTAVASAASNDVRVELHDGGVDTSAAGAALVEATIVFADGYPPLERAGEFPLRADRPSKWPADDMYARTGMFHGPAFQLVSSMDRSGEDGAEATLVGRGAEGWLRSTRTPAFLMDPMLLDAMGQIVGYWVGDRFDRGLSVFPVTLEQLEVRTGALAPNERVRCRVGVTHVDEDWIRSDIAVVAADGTVMVRMRQWEDRRLDLPRRLYDFRIAPHEVLLSDDWPNALEGLSKTDATGACRLRLPRTLLEAHGGIWLRVLAYLVLGREERREWQRLSETPKHRRLDWLAGRIVAKDAVRRLLEPRLGRLWPADIEIHADRSGRPQVRGPWIRSVGQPPHVTIAHSGGEAVAIAIDGDVCNGVGVDIEQVGRAGEVVCGAALTPRELGWVATVDDEARAEWTTRVWCAKEAVGKALGCGLSNGGRDLEVCDVDRGRGVLALAVRGSLERVRADLTGRRIMAATMSDGTVVTAAAVV